MAWSTIHSENTWEIPDRIGQMASNGEDRETLENNVYMFFNVGIKIKREIKSNGIFRRIDQICFFNRIDKENKIIVFMKDGKYTGEKIPDYILKKFIDNKENELLIYNDLIKSRFICQEVFA